MLHPVIIRNQVPYCQQLRTRSNCTIAHRRRVQFYTTRIASFLRMVAFAAAKLPLSLQLNAIFWQKTLSNTNRTRVSSAESCPTELGRELHQRNPPQLEKDAILFGEMIPNKGPAEVIGRQRTAFPCRSVIPQRFLRVQPSGVRWVSREYRAGTARSVVHRIFPEVSEV